MKSIIFLFFSALQTWAGNYDQHSLYDLNRFADEVQKDLQYCADQQGLTIQKLYLKNLNSCDDRTRSQLKDLKLSVKFYTMSSLVDHIDRVDFREKMSPLMIQIMSEQISLLKLNETKQGGGKRAIGPSICLGIISIGACVETPAYEISPEITEKHLAFLKLLDTIPETQCEVGLFPRATVKLINEIADAQGLVGSRARNNVVHHKDGSVTFYSDLDPSRRDVSPERALVRKLNGKFNLVCDSYDYPSSATNFFKSQAE